MGLHYFKEENADLYFGREALTQELVGRLETTYFLAIVGASGSGKSSLVHAGLVPALRKKGYLACIITPTGAPLESLAKGFANQNGYSDVAGLKKSIAANPDGLYLAVAQPNAPQLFLIVDQFEEIFTGHPPEDDRKMFIENLMSAVSRAGQIKVLITLRADFYARCAGYQSLRQTLAHHQEFVGPMSQAELKRTILEPARRGGWQFQDGLVDLILDDVGDEPGHLPLLAHALRETWEQRRGRVMTLAGYAEVGRVEGAISTTAETVLNRFNEDQRSIARRIFLSLTELGEGTGYTRRPATLAEILSHPQDATLVEQVLQTLTDRRLLTIDKEKIEVAHEALIRECPTLQTWIRDSQATLRIQRQLTRAANEWRASRSDKSYLFQGARLALALEQAEKQELELDSHARDFLRASQQAARRSRVLTIGSLVMVTTIIAVISTLALTGQLARLLYRPLPIEYKRIESGEFQMGSTDADLAIVEILPNDLPASAQYRLSNEQPAHTVYLDTYEISRYETTNRQYYQCVRAGVCSPPSNQTYDDPAARKLPATDVNWEDARLFCAWSGALLPTEAQWEKAARSSPDQVSRIYPWGDEWPGPESALFANVVGQGQGGKPMAVDSFPKGESGYGVAGLAGNVWEWTRDWYADDYYQDPASRLPNPQGPDLGITHTARGGSFDNDWVQSRPSFRSDIFRPGDRAFDLGFRCVRENIP